MQTLKRKLTEEKTRYKSIIENNQNYREKEYLKENITKENARIKEINSVISRLTNEILKAKGNIDTITKKLSKYSDIEEKYKLAKDTVDQLELSLSASTRQIDRATVKGKQEVIDIFEVIWQREDLTSMAGDLGLPGITQASLRLSFHGKEIEFDQNRLALSIGRGPQNDLIVPHDFTSRVHARIELRRGKFVLIDQSTNGTFVLTADGREIYLRREELILEGTGSITFGRRLPADSPELVRFVCES